MTGIGEPLFGPWGKRAGVLLRAGLSFLKMELAELWKARKGDERKGLLAEIVQAETTMRLDWITGQLPMGTRSGCCRAIGLARERLKKDRKARKYRKDILKKPTLNDCPLDPLHAFDLGALCALCANLFPRPKWFRAKDAKV
jgi:hypothetical protein